VRRDMGRASARVGERLEVGKKQRLSASSLKGKTRRERTGVVAEVEHARRAVSGQHDIVGAWCLYGMSCRRGADGIYVKSERHERILNEW